MSRYTRPIAEADLAAGIREARRRVKKRNGSGYTQWAAITLPGGYYRCACKPDCGERVLTYGNVADKCVGEIEAARRNEPSVLERMRANNSGKKGRAA